jgi:Ser/Thr protein kinase RdoA (MazF antagonist)
MARPPSQIGTRPVMSRSDAAAALRRWWGIEGELDDLPSERDRNFLVRDQVGDPAIVFKLANLEEDLAFLECQHQAMTCLSRAGVPVQRIVPARNGREVVGLGDPGPPWSRALGWLPGRTLASIEAPQPGLWNDLGTVMGRTASALVDFDHPAARRTFQWDVVQAEAVIAGGVDAVSEPARHRLLEEVLDRLRHDLAPRLAGLRRSTIQNDANDHNVLVDETGSRVVGLLDFGDMVHSVTAQEAAVACAYAMLAAADPRDVMRKIVAGFDSTCHLTADELDAMPSLILARLGASVAISAHQAGLAPDDPYLSVSEEPAWNLLEWFMRTPESALRVATHEAVGR